MGPTYLEMLFYGVFSVLVVIGIVFYLCKKMKAEEADANWERIREKHHDREKNYKTLMAIAEHGVHPDRANGNIYRIRL
jgi:hypothetical protein